MAANGAECEQPQKRLGPKDKQNGSSTGLLSWWKADLINYLLAATAQPSAELIKGQDQR